MFTQPIVVRKNQMTQADRLRKVRQRMDFEENQNAALSKGGVLFFLTSLCFVVTKIEQIPSVVVR